MLKVTTHLDVEGNSRTQRQFIVNRASTSTDVQGLWLSQNELLRWTFGKRTVDPSDGSNTGSNLILARYNDAGSALGDVFSVIRATGIVSFNNVTRGVTPVGANDFVIKSYIDNRTISVNGTAGRITSSAGTQDLSANRAWTLDLATTGIAAGTYSGITFDIYGRATAATGTGITGTLTTNRIPKAASASTLNDSIINQGASNRIDIDGNLALLLDTISVPHGLYLRTSAGLSRWSFGKRTVETGSGNTGSDIALTRFDDAGVTIGEVFSVVRSTGILTFTNVARGITPVGSSDFVTKGYFDARTITINGTAGRITSSAGAQDLSANRSWTLDLATTGISAGTYGGITFDIYGRATGVSGAAISGTVNSPYIPYATGTNVFANSFISQPSASRVDIEANLIINTPQNSGASGLFLRVSGLSRWNFAKQGLETGSNAGSDLVISRFDDSGAGIDTVLSFVRATGIGTFSKVVNGVSPTASSHLVTRGFIDARTITINGTSQDLSTNRSWSVGTVTSVAMSVPTGLSVSGSPITTSGTLAVSFTAGYSIPTTASQSNWNTAYGWGNHASAGYVPGARTLTINGTTYDLTANRSWTISTGVTGSSTSGRFAIWNGSGSITGTSDFYDNGSEYLMTRSFACSADSAFREDLNVWKILSVGHSSTHGQIRVHNDGGSAPDSSAAIEIVSTTKGLIVSRMTYAQKNAINGGSAPAGLIVFQTDAGDLGLGSGFYGCVGAGIWLKLS